ncbi:MAG: hypothetical protein ABI697_01365, partial [Devosia sp.]
YAQGGKSFAFALLVAAVFAEAIADFAYALQLLRGTYQAGGITALLWVASSGLIVWAALEQREAARHPQPAAVTRRKVRRIAEAVIPAAAIGLVLLSGSLTGALGDAEYVELSAVLALAFSAFSGLREYWIIKTQAPSKPIGQSWSGAKRASRRCSRVPAIVCWCSIATGVWCISTRAPPRPSGSRTD